MGRRFYVGPRTVGQVGRDQHSTYVILGKDFRFLIGKKVMLIVEVLDEVENENKENKT